jgi:hypothetical protein
MVLDAPDGTPHLPSTQRVIELDDVDMDISLKPELGVGEC